MAGIAIGAASFGIQVCDKLVWYLDGVGNAEEHKTQYTQQVDQLADLLEKLDNVAQGCQSGCSQTLTQAGIVACADVINEIRKKMGPVLPGDTLGLHPRLNKFTEKLRYRSSRPMYCISKVWLRAYSKT